MKLDLAEREIGSGDQLLYQLDILFFLQTIPLTVLPTFLCFSLAWPHSKIVGREMVSVSKKALAGQTGCAKRSPDRFIGLNKLIIASKMKFNNKLKTLFIKHFCKLLVLPSDPPVRTDGSVVIVLLSLATKKNLFIAVMYAEARAVMMIASRARPVPAKA